MLSTGLSGVILAWLLLAVIALACQRVRYTSLHTALSLLMMLTAASTAVVGLNAFIEMPITFALLSPHWLISLRIDALSSFFIFLLGTSLLGVTCFSVRYLQTLTQKYVPGILALFVATLLLVLTANNCFTFLFAWELMALSSYFLVVSAPATAATRKAGFLYLTMAHLGLFAIASSFFLLDTHLKILTLPFTDIAELPHLHTQGIFILMLIGFGMKAGLFPLHIWLPEAHSVAPSPVSALLSGVMLKVALYGMIRFLFDFLLVDQTIEWGYTLAFLGLLTSFIGVIHAALQTDMKRLLAYSSMENIGFITLTLGLAILFYQHDLIILAHLSLLVTLLHCFNHSIFKSLLFLSTGSVLHATGMRHLGKLGGLIRYMPWVSACTLIGCLSMAGIPFFNGFISEWLYLTLFFNHASTFPFSLAILSPLLVAFSILVFGLSAFVMVKFFGVAFLGQARNTSIVKAHDVSYFEKIGLLFFAILCVLFGVCPSLIIARIQPIVSHLLGSEALIETHWFSLHVHTTIPTRLSPLLLTAGLCIILLCVTFIVRKVAVLSHRRAIPWTCGEVLTPRMQDTPEGFGQPFKHVFHHFVHLTLSVPKPDDVTPVYRAHLNEKIWYVLYYPLLTFITRATSFTRYIQQGKMSTYLSFIGITLLILLLWVAYA